MLNRCILILDAKLNLVVRIFGEMLHLGGFFAKLKNTLPLITSSLEMHLHLMDSSADICAVKTSLLRSEEAWEIGLGIAKKGRS